MKGATATTAASVPAAANIWGRICHSCQSAPCSVYSHADSAYLCAACDVHIHTASKSATPDHRVHLCESCERAPAAFICKADAASLCITCDAAIHSANPLARRHQRVPINPIQGFMYGSITQPEVGNYEMVDEEDEDEAASWLLPNPVKNSSSTNEVMFGGVGDEYLEFMEYNSGAQNQFMDNCNQQQLYSSVPKPAAEHKVHGARGDSVVPINLKEQHPLNVQLGMGYNSYNPSSISHTVSVPSMDMGIVPESAMSEMSATHTESPRSANDVISTPPTQLSPIDKEARVMRYREKKKMRKFEKTIRYASRKAYAETRPRIKGRFAKRTEVEFEVDQMFCSSLMAENGYGVVPSF